MAPRMRSDLRHGRTDHDGQSSNCKSKNLRRRRCCSRR
jgi:hypothetical protein